MKEILLHDVCIGRHTETIPKRKEAKSRKLHIRKDYNICTVRLHKKFKRLGEELYYVF